MRTFKNHIGGIMSFDNEISQEQIDSRLSMFGSKDGWSEVKNG